MLLTHRQINKQTDKQTKTGKNITSLAEVMNDVYNQTSDIGLIAKWLEAIAVTSSHSQQLIALRHFTFFLH